MAFAHCRGKNCEPGRYDITRQQNHPSQTDCRYNLIVYSAQLLDHFENPRNAGELANPNATARLENPACGDILELSAKLDNGHVAEIRFRAKGCVPAIACGSALTELVKGKTVQEARRLTREQLVAKVGGLPQASLHVSHLVIDTLAILLGNIRAE